MLQLPGPSFFLSAACSPAFKAPPTEEPAVHEQACNHGNRGCQTTKMAHSKLKHKRPNCSISDQYN